MTPFERLCYLVPMTERLIVDEAELDMKIFAEDSRDFYNCGTAACLAGWAARDPTLRADGLTMWRDDDMAVVSYRGLGCWHSLQHFFDISPRQAEYLFGGQNSNSLRHALARVHHVINEQRKAAE